MLSIAISIIAIPSELAKSEKKTTRSKRSNDSSRTIHSYCQPSEIHQNPSIHRTPLNLHRDPKCRVDVPEPRIRRAIVCLHRQRLECSELISVLILFDEEALFGFIITVLQNIATTSSAISVDFRCINYCIFFVLVFDIVFNFVFSITGNINDPILIDLELL